jgi:hypothetical protein
MLLCLGLGLIAALSAASPGAAASRQPGAGPASVARMPASRARQTPQQTAKTDEYRLSEERYEKAVAYSRASYRMYFVSVFLTLLVLVVLLQAGVAARYRDWAERASDKRFLQALLFVPLLVLSADVAELPLRVYGHTLSVRYQMSVQGWGSWFLDWGKQQLLTVGFALILVVGLSSLLRKSPRRWWFYGWCAAMPVTVFVIFISPWFIEFALDERNLAGGRPLPDGRGSVSFI